MHEDDPALGRPEPTRGPAAGESPNPAGGTLRSGGAAPSQAGAAAKRRRWSLDREDIQSEQQAGDAGAGSGVQHGAETDGGPAARGGSEPAAPSASAGEEPSGGAALEADDAGEVPASSRSGFRLAAFGALLVVVLFAGYGLGRLNSGVASASAPPSGANAAGGAPMAGMTVDENQPHVHNTNGTVSQGGVSAPMGSMVGGLSLSAGGLTLVPLNTDFVAGQRRQLLFRIADNQGTAITSYATVHDKPLHLVVVRRDLSGFQHLHPTMAPDGTWQIDLTLREPGIYRMVADFTAVAGGQQLATTLGTDLTVTGQYSPRALPPPAVSDVVDGFGVAYEGKPGTAATQPMLMNVASPDGKPVALEPYLGAFGHLVVMRDGDLAYVHVHPETQLVDGKVKFWVAMPSAGRYRMFFDFQVAGRVRTAEWTAVVS